MLVGTFEKKKKYLKNVGLATGFDKTTVYREKKMLSVSSPGPR